MAQFLLIEFSGLPTLGPIISDISPSILEIQNTPNIFDWNGFKGVMDKNPQKSEIGKYAILTQPRNFTFFEDEIFQLFSYLYGLKVPK